MSSSCYHIGTNRLSQDEYQVTNIDVVNKRSNKNLFKTALEKLNKRYKKHKKISDNLYEVIVIHKEKDDDDDDEPQVDSLVPPTPPTRTRIRERSYSRNSVWSNGTGTGTGTVPPTPPPRSRRNSQSSFGRNIPLNDTIPPTPPPRSRPHSRSSCRGPAGSGMFHHGCISIY